MKASKIIFITICIIGIVLVLLAFLMPSLQRVRHQSRNVAEQSKIKQQVLQERIAKESVQNTPGAEDYASNQETATKPNKKSLTEVRATIQFRWETRPYGYQW
jgi:uncharacterized membrane protein